MIDTEQQLDVLIRAVTVLRSAPKGKRDEMVIALMELRIDEHRAELRARTA